MSKKIILVMGPPGSGKGTQADLLERDLHLAHISTGELFRNEISNNTELGMKAKSYMEKGEYVPDEITTGMLKNRMAADDCSTGIILDGFPRTIAQAEFLDKFLLESGDSVSRVIYYNVPDEEDVNRIKGRAEHDIEEGKNARADDLNEETIMQRLSVYHEKTEPILDYYRAKGIVLEIDATKSINEILDETEDEL